MGQVPAKYFLPSAPYGASEGANAVNPTQPGAVNPQTPLLPPNFTDPGTMQKPTGQGLTPTLGGNQAQGGGGNYQQLFRGLFR